MEYVTLIGNEILFAPYEENLFFMKVIDSDPALLNQEYGFDVIFSGVSEIDKQGSEYDVGYVYQYHMPVKIRGPVRKVRTDYLVKNIRVELNLDYQLKEIWHLP